MAKKEKTDLKLTKSGSTEKKQTEVDIKKCSSNLLRILKSKNISAFIAMKIIFHLPPKIEYFLKDTKDRDTKTEYVVFQQGIISIFVRKN